MAGATQAGLLRTTNQAPSKAHASCIRSSSETWAPRLGPQPGVHISRSRRSESPKQAHWDPNERLPHRRASSLAGMLIRRRGQFHCIFSSSRGQQYSVVMERACRTKNHLPVPQTPSESERLDEASEASSAPGHSELPDNKNKNKREGRGSHVYLSKQEGRKAPMPAGQRVGC